MPDINTIPAASLLQDQLTALNQAIFSLNNGAGVQGMTISSPPALDGKAREAAGGSSLVPPSSVILYPIITDPDDVATVTVLLQNQADRITAKLVEMGYTESRTAGTLWGAPRIIPFAEPPPLEPPPYGPSPTVPPAWSPPVIPPPPPEPHPGPPPIEGEPQPPGGGAFPADPVPLPPTPQPPLTQPGAAAAAATAAQTQAPVGPQRFEVTVEPSPPNPVE